MKATFPILLACSIGIAYALECYDCVYAKGYSWSNKECEKKPKNNRNCGSRNDLSTDPIIEVDLVGSNSTIRQSTKFMCGKGYGKYNGTDVVVRGCAQVLSTQDPKCGVQSDWTIVFNVGANITMRNLTSCYCPKDNCNSAGLPLASLSVVGSLLLLCKVLFM